MSRPEPSSLRELERLLAYSAARADIETMCALVRDQQRPCPAGSDWYDTAMTGSHDEDVAWVARAVRYLECLGLLVRDHQDRNVVRVLDLEAR